jgi:murein DD-endopeptidase MepM/ murein hydrolase activator NlpD
MNAYPKSHLRTALIIAVCLMIALLVLPDQNTSAMSRVPVSLAISAEELSTAVEATSTVVPEPQVAAVAEASRAAQTTVTIQRGDSLSAIFKRAGLSAYELQRVMELGKAVAVLKKIIPGKTLAFETDQDDQLVSLSYEESPLKHLIVMRKGPDYKAYWQEAEAETIISYGSAVISESHPSLYHAGKAAGLSDAVIMKLSYVFQWDISFALDLRQGDAFTVLFEDIYVDGEKVKEGEILAAQFINMGKTYTAVSYEDSAGNRNYYAPDGSSLRKAFLRDPVHFSHVSSSFNLKRLHPIHNRVMPHRGIDYAAREGTPVLASGDGKVMSVKRNSASGRFIVIQHGEQYTTKYLHLSAYAKGITSGKSVKQGQVIGYVGATGWATAPHLHYEFLLNGVHRNPKTVKLPHALPIAKTELNRFQSSAQTLVARLDAVAGKSNLALANRAAD